MNRQAKLATFSTGALLLAIIYWNITDWWAYVGSGPSARPKFEMPLGWKIIESAFVGFVASGVLLGGGLLLRRGARYLTTASD